MSNNSGSHTPPDSKQAADAELQPARDSGYFWRHRKARLLSWFGLEDGMDVLEAGSGPGFITAQLQTLVRN